MNSSSLTGGRSMSRTGTAPRTIHYSLPRNDTRFEYQNSKHLQVHNPSIELKGTLNIRAVSGVKQDREYEPFRKMNVKCIPDTKRTLNPSYNTEPKEITRSKSVGLLKKMNSNANMLAPGNMENLFTRTDNCQRVTDKPKNVNKNRFESNVLANQDLRKYEPPKKILHYNEFSKYTDTTQILHLPGGQKRTCSEIRDDEDYKKFSKKGEVELSSKIKQSLDFKSQVDCLKPTLSSVRL